MSNNIRYTTNNGIIHKQYRKALELEKYGDYKTAIELYKLNIEKFNHSESKIRLAKLYLEGKSTKIDNKLARELLEEAYNQGDMKARQLLAYTYSNGIGGEKRENEAFLMFKKELDESNPDPMIYIELLKLMPKSKKNKELRKSLKKVVTSAEKRQYKRKASIDRFNNTRLGRIANFLPNAVYRVFEYGIEERRNREVEYSLEDLYQKAKEYEENGDEKTARRIYKRLSNYGDKEASLKYARMLTKGVGGKQEVEKAKEIYDNIIFKTNKKINKFTSRITNIENYLNSIQNSDKKISRREKKEISLLEEELNELREKRSKLTTDNSYSESCLRLGLLLVDYPLNDQEFEQGIGYLKLFSDEGEFIPEEGKKLTKFGKRENRRAQIAASKLAHLFEQGKWQPENVEEERLRFLKFASSEKNEYISHVSEKMMRDSENIDDNREEGVERPRIKKSHGKECKVRYELGCLCEVLHLNRFARKLFASMSKAGDYRCSYDLALLEHKGKGGERDTESAKRHYRECIKYLAGKEDITKGEELTRFVAVNQIAKILLEENDVNGAVELYKISAKRGISDSKRMLRQLNEQGLWKPENEMEAEWIKQKGITKAIGFIRSKISQIPEIHIPVSLKTRAKQALATSVVLATATATASYALSENINAMAEKEPQFIEQNASEKFFTIGDEVILGNPEKSTTAQIIGLVAFNVEKNELIRNRNLNVGNLGLSGEEYLEDIVQTRHVDKKNIKLAYCVKSGEKIDWVTAESEQMSIFRPYIAKKKEENFRDFT